MNELSRQRPPIAESAWFWMFLFSIIGLLALGIIGPKYGRRQAMIEQNYEGRQEAARRMAQKSGQGFPADRSAAPPGGSKLIIGLEPLLAAVSVLVVVSAAGLWWQYKRPSDAPPL